MKYAVVTGASSGLGIEFSQKLDKMGYQLILVARREERLKALQQSLSNPSRIIVCDLSKKEECFRLYDLIKDLDIEVFINNAGFGDCGYFKERALEKELNMLSVNVEAVHILTKMMVLKMEQGYILNVASSAGLIPAGPFMATYYATKAYVTSLTRGIAEELREKGSKLYIGCLCPGPVDTEFNAVADVEFALKGITASYCVEYALKCMFKRKVTIIPGFTMKLANFAGRFVPISLYVRIVARQQKRKIYQ